MGLPKKRPIYKRKEFWVGVFALWVSMGSLGFFGYALAAPILREKLKGSSFELVFGSLPVSVEHHPCSLPCILNATLTVSHYDKWTWDAELERGQLIRIRAEGHSQMSTEFLHKTTGYHYSSLNEVVIQQSGHTP